MNFLQGWWEWEHFLSALLKLGAAFFLALPIAWERERSSGRWGCAPSPWVAVASCAYVLVAIRVVGLDADPQLASFKRFLTPFEEKIDNSQARADLQLRYWSCILYGVQPTVFCFWRRSSKGHGAFHRTFIATKEVSIWQRLLP